jgi:uncharacterized protein (TIRG00374 family)
MLVDAQNRRRVAGRIAFLLVTLVAFYFVMPGLLATFDAVPRLRAVFPAWFVVVAVLEAASFVGLWELQRIALGADSLFDVGASHTAGNAVSRAIPGGVATGGAVQLRMLHRAGFDVPTATSALTAAGLLSTAMLFALPVLALPAILAGVGIDARLLQGAVVAVILFAVLCLFSVWLIRSDRGVAAVGRAIGRIARLLRIKTETDLGEQVVNARNQVRDGLRDSWRRAVPAAAASQLLDFLALEASVLAVGGDIDPMLVLLAYVAAGTLSMIPITPGGLGFVEAGLTGVLTVAGLSPDQAVLATLLYRLFAYWLPLPAGLVASVWFNRRHPIPRPA